ncbi:MAG: hypothetical protein ACREGB_05190 [Candidatus Saccharimonadales bacterium]
MHYNLGERQKLKKRLPYRRVVIATLIVLALVGGYLVYSHHSVGIKKPPVPVKVVPQ